MRKEERSAAMNADIKTLFSEIVTAMEEAKVNGLVPQITPDGSEYTIALETDEPGYTIKLAKGVRRGSLIKTYKRGIPQYETELLDASMQDVLRIVQAAIIIAYGKSMH
jgi:hypothetical protein